MSTEALFGRFDTQITRAGEAELTVAFTNPVEPSNQKKIAAWLAKATNAVRTVYGAYPRKQLLILITDVNKRSSEATPYAMVLRGEGTVLQFFVNQHASEYEFTTDWTAYHELSHLLIPFIQRQDAWVSEGLASYYQYLVMSRAGVIDSSTAIERLYGGIQRGYESYQYAPNTRLDKVSKNRRRYRSTRRIYWTGAIMWLQADLQLRQQGSSLDKVLAKLNQCCLPAGDMWDANQLARQLDQFLDQPLFVPLFNATAASTQYPEIAPLLKQLAIEIDQQEIKFIGSSTLRSQLTESSSD